MAVGKGGLETIESNNDRIKAKLEDLHDCWNTFQYVTKHLDDWASETVIGEAIQSDAQQCSDLLAKTGNVLTKLTQYVDNFVEEQSRINTEI